MSKATFSASFIAAEASSTFNSSSWTPVGEAYSLEDIWAETHPGLYENIKGDTAEVTATNFTDGVGLRINVPFKDGSSLELKLSGKSNLEEGDKVLISSITGQELKKVGSKNIVRYDGELAE